MRSVLRWYLRSSLPGRTRLPPLLATAWPPLRRVPLQIAAGQTIFLDMHDALSRDVLRDSPYREHPWEAAEQQLMRRIVRGGDVAFDIGAHLGEHCALLTSLVGATGHVFAFEPNPERWHGLSLTVTQRGNGELVPVALADRVGTDDLIVPDLHSMASFAPWTTGDVGAIRRIQVQVTTLDTLIANGKVPLPQFIKCDVEGSEWAVFRGAASILDRADAPMILYEANRQSARAMGLSVAASTELLRSMTAAAYRFHLVTAGGGLQEIEQPERLSNILAVPQRMRERLQASR